MDDVKDKLRARLNTVLHYERHRKIQVIVSTLTLVGAVIATFYPDYGHAATLAGVVTNLVWVWE